MKRILPYLIIIISFFAFILPIKADTLTDFTGSYTPYSCTEISTGTGTCITTSNMGTYNIGTAASLSNIENFIVRAFADFKAGNTYTIRFYVNITPKNFSEISNGFSAIGFAGQTSSGWISEPFTAKSVTLENVSGSTTQVIYTFRASSDSNLTGIAFTIYTGLLTGIESFNVSKIQIDYTEGIGAVIENQTTVIINKTDEVINKQEETNQKLDDLNDNITDDNVDSANDSASSFFNDFSTDTFGLTSIITAPLNLITSITSSSCSNLILPLPYVDKNLTLPCMNTIYTKYFGSFFTIYQTITFGIIAYWICVRIFAMVKDFKNPDHDEVEVLDL